ncbi:MAG: hypothetical protein BRD21_02605 [Halobacteriales archaeon SW_8_66_22]|nr:MAG: hypothetical protein BRD21_02605 [Halobacteriales archaeon SW_8_66_22]
MNRRDLLAAAGGALAAVLAGCLGDDSDDDSPDDGNGMENGDDSGPDGDATPSPTPTEGDGTGENGGGNGTDDTGESTDDGSGNIDTEDEQAAIDLLHEDSELTPEHIRRDLEFFEGADVTLTERGISDFQEGLLTVRGLLDVDHPEEGQMTVGLELKLRQTSTGRWRIIDGRAVQLDTSDSGSDGQDGGQSDGDGGSDGDDQSTGDDSDEDGNGTGSDEQTNGTA